MNQPALKSHGTDLTKGSASRSINNLNNIKYGFRSSFRALLLTLFLALVVGQSAIYVTMAAEETVTLSSSGVWVSTNGGSGVTGTGTNEVRWGSVAYPYNTKSGMRFDGQSASFTTGQEFCLGQLTHFNWPITNAASGAKLRVSLHFATPSISTDPTFDFDIAIDETTNPSTTCALSSCTYSPCSTIPCPDRISWSNSIPTQTFTIGSDTYTLQMVGFKDSCPSGNLVTKLVTQETMDNKAYLVGKIVLTRPAIHIEKKTNGEDADTGMGPTILSGCPITWTYEVTNAGNVALIDVSVTDNPAQTITRISGDTNSDNKLDLTETWVYRATGNAQFGQYSNIATVQGRKDSSTSYVTDTDPSHYFGQTLTLSVPSVTVCAGGTATFTVTPTPSDTGNYNYQWQVKAGSSWSDISGATNPVLSITAAAADNGKQYRVNVGLKNQSTCTVSSGAATLTVRPTITISGPASATVCAGAVAAFTVAPTPSDTGNYSYQWQVNGGSGWSDISGATNPGFSFMAATADSGKQYRVVTGYKAQPSCPATSGTATLTVMPTITISGPASATVCAGAVAAFTVTPTPSDTGNYNYRWQVNGGSGWSDISGATNPGFSFIAATADSGKQYRVVMGYKAQPSCPATSGAATLTVRPTIVLNGPASATVCAGVVAAFAVAPNPSDPGNYSYQWQVNGGSGWSDISGATNPGFSFIAATADSGKQYRVVTGYKAQPSCPATSGTATLTVQGRTSVNAGSDQTICVNENAILAGTATNYASAVWTIAEGSGTLTQIPIDPGNPTQIKATFTATSSPGNLFTTTVAKLTATSTTHCPGEVNDTLTIKVLQIPLVAIHVESPVQV